MPEKIVFIGFENEMTAERRNILEAFLKMKKVNAKTEYLMPDRENLNDITKKLIETVEENEDCVFDLTGGKELVLVAMGIVSASHNVPMLRIDINKDCVIPIKNIKDLSDIKPSHMTVEEIIALNGGRVIKSNPFGAKWNFSDEFIKDIFSLWNICKINSGAWNRQCNAFEHARYNGDAYELYLDREVHDTRFQMMSKKIVDSLLRCGMLINYFRRGDTIYFRYKNEQIRKCLIKAGNVLELYFYASLLKIKQSSPHLISDAAIGVFVDWKNDISIYKNDILETKNEIDIMFTNKMIPVFVSCKNGEVKKEDLYELDTVAEKFGGEYAKKILVSTYISSNSESRAHILSRANRMQIYVISDSDKISEDEFTKKITSLIKA